MILIDAVPRSFFHSHHFPPSKACRAGQRTSLRLSDYHCLRAQEKKHVKSCATIQAPHKFSAPLALFSSVTWMYCILVFCVLWSYCLSSSCSPSFSLQHMVLFLAPCSSMFEPLPTSVDALSLPNWARAKALDTMYQDLCTSPKLSLAFHLYAIPDLEPSCEPATDFHLQVLLLCVEESREDISHHFQEQRKSIIWLTFLKWLHSNFDLSDVDRLHLQEQDSSKVAPLTLFESERIYNLHFLTSAIWQDLL